MSAGIEELSPRITVCYGPDMKEHSRVALGIKWCFKCRKRAEFAAVVMFPVIDLDDPASMYAAMWGPDMFNECGNCGKHDGDLFPGWYRSYEEDW